MTPPAQRTATALRELAETLRQTIGDFEQLIQRADALRDEVASGRPLAEAMADEVRPLIITQLTIITDRLYAAGGEVRRAEAQQLKSEGLTQEGIAEVFGVSRQRAAMLLRPPSGGKPKRPAPQG